jgi:hypothetical protein
MTLTRLYNEAYNRVYSRTTKGCAVLLGVGLIAAAAAVGAALTA